MKYILLIIVFITMAGCHGHQDHSHSHSHHDHDHAHDETLQLFAYGAGVEVFAEAMPFVAGQPSDIIAYFTHLEDFKPMLEGSVTARLFIGWNSVDQTLEQPTSPGIYEFSLQPTTTGRGRLVFEVKTAEDEFQITIPNITIFSNEHDAHEAAAEEAVTSVNGAVFTKEQSWKVDFATEEARREPFGQIIRTTAQIQPAQGDQRIVAAQMSGIALFSNDNMMEGRAVSAGQTLFTIDGSGMADNNLAVRIAEAESEYNRAKAEYERKSALAAENVVSQSEVLNARAEFINAEAVYNNLRRNFSGGRQTVSSPISGFITRVLVGNGEYVEAGQSVMVVSQNRDLFIKAELQPRHFEVLGNVASANIRTLNNNSAYTLEELGGRMVSYGRSTDVNNPLIPVIFQVNNRAGCCRAVS